jgi:hypothetical protein
MDLKKTTMLKSCRTAALVAIGWYLMAAPVKWGTLANGNGGFKLASDVPLAEWNHLQSFDSAEQCEKFLSALQDIAKTKLAARPKKDLDFTALQLFSEMIECIASDDPRLNGS